MDREKFITFELHQEQILDNIVKRRKELGFSQYYISKELHLSANAYHKVERGQTKLDVIRLFQIADILAVNPRELIGNPI